MKEFDYQRAWDELAHPGFQALPRNVRDLCRRVCVEAASCQQNSDAHCSLQWPREERFLRSAFNAVPTEFLAEAAKIVHAFGHWRHDPWPQWLIEEWTREGEEFPDVGNGWWWKFSNYADQILRAKILGASIPTPVRSGLLRPKKQAKASAHSVRLDIHDGELVSQLNTPRSTGRIPLGLASAETASKVLEIEAPAMPASLDELIKRFEVRAEIVKVPTRDEWEGSSYDVVFSRKTDAKLTRKLRVEYNQGSAFENPTPGAVLECILGDALGVQNAGDFESWATDLGFDPDSRKAKRAHDQIVAQRKRLEAMFSAAERSELYKAIGGDDRRLDRSVEAYAEQIKALIPKRTGYAASMLDLAAYMVDR